MSNRYVHGLTTDAPNREKDDFYTTPESATLSLLSVECFNGAIHEPACGDGAISKVLESSGHEVISTDLVNRRFGTPGVDYLMEYRPVAPNVITNPPFKLALPFATKALSLTTGKVALLCRLAWLEGIERKTFFENSPLARVWVFSSRLTMLRNGNDGGKGGGSMIAFAWFVWEHGYKGHPTLGWIKA